MSIKFPGGISADYLDYISRHPDEIGKNFKLDVGNAMNAYNAQVDTASQYRTLVDARQKVQLKTSLAGESVSPFEQRLQGVKTSVGELLSNAKNSGIYKRVAQFSSTGTGKAALFTAGLLIGSAIFGRKDKA